MARRAEIIRVFTDALAPYVGATMAGASVRGHCDKLGIADGEVREEQVQALLEALAPGLQVFVGRERAALVVAEIRRTLDRQRGGQ